MRKNPLAVLLVISGVFFVIFVVVAVATMSTFKPGKTQKKFFAGASGIGVVDIKGVIMDSKKTVEQLDELSDDQQIKGVVVRVNSPGGSVAPSQEIYETIKKIGNKKPVYVSMSSVAASGGLYVSLGAKKIFANPGTITGSIGVIMQFADLSKLFQWAKVNPYNIKTGRFKDIGSPNREMTAEEKAILQSMIDNVLGQFRRAVATARSLPMEKIVEISDGRIFSGEQAKQAKLVDELGGFSDTVDALAKDVGIQGKPTLFYPRKKHSVLEAVLGNLDDDEDSSESSIGRGVSISKAVRAFLEIVGDARPGGATGSGLGLGLGLHGPLFLMPYGAE